MVVAETMNKPTLKVSMSDSDSSSNAESEESEEEMEVQSKEPQDAEADVESGSSDAEGSESDSGAEGGALMTNEGWADAVAKVLGSTKPKNKKTLVLSRAKKHSEIVKKEKEDKPEFEVIGESKDDVQPVKKEEPGSGEPLVKKKKVEKEKSKIRLKPNILEKDRERILNKIATKGVVQLFNAVRNQQKTLEKEMSEDLTETKKEKILKKFDKRTFLDSLMGNTKSVIVDEAKKLKNEPKTEDDDPKWSALRDDFMMGAKMKDWDKESVDE